MTSPMWLRSQDINEDGYYWYDEGDSFVIVEIASAAWRAERSVYYCSSESIGELSESTGEFFGPLNPPDRSSR